MIKAKPDCSHSLVFECDFDEPPEKVWRTLTEPELLEAWLKDDDAADCVEYEIVAAEPHRLLRYRWRDNEEGSGEPNGRQIDSIVTVELTPGTTGGTHLKLTHGEFRVVSLRHVMAVARVSPIASARRRKTPILSFAAQCSLRRAA